MGRKKAPTYRVVVMPKHRDPKAHVVEILGHYNPRMTPSELVLNADRIKHWISQGAEVTDTVWNLLVGEQLVEGEKRKSTSLSKKRRAKMTKKDEEKKEAEAAAKAKAEKQAQADKEAAEEKKAEAAKPAEPTNEESAQEANTDEPTPSEDTEEKTPSQ